MNTQEPLNFLSAKASAPKIGAEAIQFLVLNLYLLFGKVEFIPVGFPVFF